jgi:precorrin-6Y C5,15-methyltransferase (decarboxylating)
MEPVTIIGMGMAPQDLTAEHQQLIAAADILVGGKRLLDYFKNSRARKKVIGRDIDGVIDFVKREMKKHKIVVLASGDPLYFGIGARMAEVLEPQHTVIYPNISSVAAAFGRIKEGWNDVRVVSLHGRKNERLLFKALEKENKIAVLTDSKNNPARLAAHLLQKEVFNFRICVLEALGGRSEKFGWYTLPEAAKMKFTEPNLVVLKRSTVGTAQKLSLQLGAPDSWYDHPAGLITKSEIRALTLSKLRLAADHIFWDLGAGSGSIALEASLFVKKGEIIAVEQESSRIECIKNNKKQFGVRRLKIVRAKLPDGLAGLPRPDRVFIGGGGRDLKAIIIESARYLKPDGRIVINTVLIPNIQRALTSLRELGFETDCLQVQINRSRQMPWAERFEAQNPVWIISGKRER